MLLIGPYSSNSLFSFRSVASKLMRATNRVLKGSACNAIQALHCFWATSIPGDSSQGLKESDNIGSMAPIHEYADLAVHPEQNVHWVPA